MTEDENSRDEAFHQGDDERNVYGAAMYAIEVGRRPGSGEPYAIIKGLLLEDFDPDRLGQHAPEGGEPVIETLLRRDEETGLWQTEQSRMRGEDGEWQYMGVSGISMDPLEGIRMLLEGEA